ncbi:allantoate amidohydrolase [Nocardioides nitrophenolicus]|uniref:allantoate amidohydrolase n=1 Tax=Nocardioides nitrophenolicus TaxID=60489 RepID=UPI001958D247|nr:allantoate amidohydrolase [Nocardioides nitrophenolicus]MBM7518560.1 N-carbamoyl-L-amino-acid hydrolase [Nocardioides nitrophenolicus]
MSVSERLAAIAAIGRDDARGGYSRHLLEPADLRLREWFRSTAQDLGLSVEVDGNGNLWAWWGEDRTGAVATGSHLDSVPGGGAYDGPLGVVSAFEAVAILRAEGWSPARPVVVCAFAEEEGSRFGMPCLGSRLMVGEIEPAEALRRADRDGTTLEQAWREAGLAVSSLGPDAGRLAALDVFVELHVEQGRDLEDRGLPLAVSSSILAHGRWRLSVHGEGNHAGSTPMAGRRDPVVAAAAAILAVRQVALERPAARGTVGRVSVTPNGTNVIASRVDAWLDIRGGSDAQVREQLDVTLELIRARVADEGCRLEVEEESFSSLVAFDEPLTRRVASTLGDLPAIPTGAGHDAGVLSAYLPCAMIFVRNPTGVSHAPEEAARDEDCEAGARALAAVLRELAGTPVR